MNRKHAKELLPIIKAFGDGKVVQWRRLETNDWNDCGAHDWNDCGESEPFANPHLYEYRVKPEPFECWVNVYPNKVMYAYPTAIAALAGKQAASAKVRTLHMTQSVCLNSSESLPVYPLEE